MEELASHGSSPSLGSLSPGECCRGAGLDPIATATNKPPNPTPWGLRLAFGSPARVFRATDSAFPSERGGGGKEFWEVPLLGPDWGNSVAWPSRPRPSREVKTWTWSWLRCQVRGQTTEGWSYHMLPHGPGLEREVHSVPKQWDIGYGWEHGSSEKPSNAAKGTQQRKCWCPSQNSCELGS